MMFFYVFISLKNMLSLVIQKPISKYLLDSRSAAIFSLFEKAKCAVCTIKNLINAKL